MAMTPPASVIELLQAMVRIDTVNGAVTGVQRAEAPLAELLAGFAGAWLMETELLPAEGQADQLLITHRVGEDRPWILFDSHMDTVSVQGMTIDPFSAEIADGKLFGRGACDTKGTGAAMLWALRQYGLSNDRPNNIALLFSVNEEISMTGIKSFVANDLPRFDWSPHLVIVGEPTEHLPVIAHNGCLRFEIATQGKAVHSSVPWEGRSAIRDMVKALGVIEQGYIAKLDAEHDLTGRAACSINLLQGGSAPNIVPEHCACEVDRRLIPGEDAEQVLADIRALLDPLVDEDTGFDYRITVRVQHPPLLPEHSAAALPYVQAALAEHGIRRPAVGAPFATHGGYLGAAGLPTIVFGPGSPYPAHTKDEWVSVKEIEQGTKVYESLMRADLAD